MRYLLLAAGVIALAGCGGDSGAKACEVTAVDESRAKEQP